ncbi:hypothetical protein BST36_09005 [Mycolicibacterium moriokaense]|uniref:Cupin domain-containing protein n=2 Tax=Mycolicibacterium moriokaense TaxID=39691 RepID=A0AAD1HH04_9MYCO|nr:hypothetical protein [Mycolicibacterium moriokaense]MCV7042116.1 hypothetical protein [Mycolicibacterium moriokaense]ORB25183.1 hypothetical protein BST36_09005 [Mycolicibacterium moriokaense]BBX04886.1 hypothetical protein MMOR_58220 [Mycolicibacterium moriokaense]
MPVSRPADLPVGGGGRWPLCGSGFRSAQWGDMEVGYTTTGVGDHTPVYQGLPGGVCPVPHYGYVFTGRIRCRFPGSDWPDEVASTGEAYFFPAGHVLIYEEETEALELNPAAALQTLMDHIESLAQRFRDSQ